MPDHASNHPSELERVTTPDWPALEIDCWKCRGTGTVTTLFPVGDRNRVACDRCAGRCRLPTAFGEEVLAFVRSRMREVGELR